MVRSRSYDAASAYGKRDTSPRGGEFSRSRRFLPDSQPPSAVSVSGHFVMVEESRFEVGPGSYQPRVPRITGVAKFQKDRRFLPSGQPPSAISPSGHFCDVDEYEHDVGPGSYSPGGSRIKGVGKFQKAPRFLPSGQPPSAISPSGHFCDVDEYEFDVGPGSYSPGGSRIKGVGKFQKAPRFLPGGQPPSAMSPSGHFCEVDEWEYDVGPGSYDSGYSPTPRKVNGTAEFQKERRFRKLENATTDESVGPGTYLGVSSEPNMISTPSAKAARPATPRLKENDGDHAPAGKVGKKNASIPAKRNSFRSPSLESGDESDSDITTPVKSARNLKENLDSPQKMKQTNNRGAGARSARSEPPKVRK